MRKVSPAESARHTASVYRSEAEARRPHQPDFAMTLDQWARNADARAEAADLDEQPDLFAAPHQRDAA